MRMRVFGKQLALASHIGCTEAAVSFWETGQRVPKERTLLRILESFRARGSSGAELNALRMAWREARHDRAHDAGFGSGVHRAVRPVDEPEMRAAANEVK
jgi:hypothetical protein